MKIRSIDWMAVMLLRYLRNFVKDRRGNFAPMFALAAVPLVGLVGASIDYSNANAARSAMQAAIDSTALMLSKDAQTMTPAQLNQKATEYFKALFNRADATNVTIAPVFTSPQSGSFKLVVNGSGQVPTSFTRIFGHDYTDIGVKAEVLWGMKKLELALALDNTGSMQSNGKMTELKKAAHSLLATLKTAAKTPGDVKVAIIPFDTTVNIGTTYKNQNWFDYDSLDCNGNQSGSGCTSGNWKNYWDGCVRDRTYPYDTQDNIPDTGIPATLYPVHDCGSLTTMMPLTYDWTALDNKVDQMNPNGNTNVTIGLVWAWHALTTQAPLNEAATPAPDLDKVIILLTDGDNTESWKNSNNSKVTSQSAIDDRTRIVCTNVKNAGIKLYTIRVINGNASLLQSCASTPNQYYDVQQASQLNAVFSAIAQNLANLRISK